MTREELLADPSNGAGADLCGADLCGANLRGAYLRGAYLRDANLRDANLYGATFSPGVHVWQFGPGGSRKDYLVVMQGPGLDDVRTGCFHGPLAEFAAAVEKTHGGNRHGRWYRGIIALVRAETEGEE
jgi:hypothetical protein